MSDDVPIEGPRDTEAMVVQDAEFILEPGVGLTVRVDNKSQWLSWDETVELAEWLFSRVAIAVELRRRADSQ